MCADKFFQEKNARKVLEIKKECLTLQRKSRKADANMVRLAQLVRASDCGSEGRGFDPHTSPRAKSPVSNRAFSLSQYHCYEPYTPPV